MFFNLDFVKNDEIANNSAKQLEKKNNANFDSLELMIFWQILT
jgi:hypothetical protein